MRVLILAPHTDDGEFGCGGTIAKMVAGNDEVFYTAFSTASDSVPSSLPKNILEIEVKKAIAVLGIPLANLIIYKYQVRKLNYVRQEVLDRMIELRERLKPDLVFLPSLNDIHQDHQTVAQEALRAFKHGCMLGYELPWNTFSFNPGLFVKLEAWHLANKLEALQAYESQAHRLYANKDFIEGLARVRGVQIGVDYAEAFEVIRWIL